VWVIHQPINESKLIMYQTKWIIFTNQPSKKGNLYHHSINKGNPYHLPITKGTGNVINNIVLISKIDSTFTMFVIFTKGNIYEQKNP